MTCGASNTRHGMPGFLSTELPFTAIRWLETKHSEEMGWGQVKHGHCACKSWTGAEQSMKAMVGDFFCRTF